MDIKFIKKIDDTTDPRYNNGDTVENAEDVFGVAQARYFVETGYAEIVGTKKEKAIMPKADTPEK